MNGRDRPVARKGGTRSSVAARDVLLSAGGELGRVQQMGRTDRAVSSPCSSMSRLSGLTPWRLYPSLTAPNQEYLLDLSGGRKEEQAQRTQ